MAIESGLPSRYEIRTLGPEHSDWANAIVMHSTSFASPVWSKIYSEGKTGMCYSMFKVGAHLINHQIESGLSLGIFDKEYKFKRPESVATGGKLYWNLNDESADEVALLEQMDFPLVSVAMAYDSSNPLDMARITPLVEIMPLLGVRNRILQERDTRDPKSWQATGPGQVLFRNATATKAGEEGRGLMKLLAQYMMRKSAAEGFRGIQIQCLHDAVNHVWSQPPEPFKGEVVAKFNCASDEDEEVRRSFQGSNQDITKVYVTLKLLDQIDRQKTRDPLVVE
ncbi:uncharacterized protein BCR38DRAFT_457594 [Pseudomassariella vexata]|uniref:Uncharacterized protein n=1 Tax=Pseudomassariella vexata TaxID=1141098 RepID=A0A1Y2E1Q8_9PEZI|nr:uncharacterized protein BCR38DRAFT_457594 [Pseudomassariella vexata]ORY65439.1 hypothetical protein BCR38DRAFT_457594 [Pseudomassariella vexata]